MTLERPGLEASGVGFDRVERVPTKNSDLTIADPLLVFYLRLNGSLYFALSFSTVILQTCGIFHTQILHESYFSFIASLIRL